jgi:predicted transposase YdaD
MRQSLSEKKPSSKPFDVTTKHLLEMRPADWLEYVGCKRRGPVRLIDADLATVTAEADKVLRVDETEPWLAHFELQAAYQRRLGRRTLRYNVLLDDRHGVPVESFVILLRPEADGPAVMGVVERRRRDGRTDLRFEYTVVRAWQQPVDRVLRGGLATLPLAPLADAPPSELPQVIRRIDERLRREARPNESATLWTATYLLLGLRYPAEFAHALLKGVRNMKESTTYQAILEEGHAKGVEEGSLEEARELLLRLGRKRFGAPDRRVSSAIQRLDVKKLEQLVDRLLDASSWTELLRAR